MIEQNQTDARYQIRDSEVCQTLTARCGTGGGHVPMVIFTVSETQDTDGGTMEPLQKQSDTVRTESTAETLFCGQNNRNIRPVIENYTGGVLQQHLTQVTTKELEQEMEKNESSSSLSNRKFVLRRLTPTECARLQGFPDWWCDGAEGSDSAQYKLWGNGIALPCAYDVMKRLAKELRRT